MNHASRGRCLCLCHPKRCHLSLDVRLQSSNNIMNTPTLLLMMLAMHSAWTTARISSPCGWPLVAWIGLLLPGQNLDHVAVKRYTGDRIRLWQCSLSLRHAGVGPGGPGQAQHCSHDAQRVCSDAEEVVLGRLWRHQRLALSRALEELLQESLHKAQLQASAGEVDQDCSGYETLYCTICTSMASTCPTSLYSTVYAASYI